jgi:hypothetical protein
MRRESLAMLSDIQEAVKSAMRKACSDTFAFTDNIREEVAAEYLLTVNVAHAIGANNKSFGHPYAVRIECSTKRFATSCLPLFKKTPANNFLTYTHVLRKPKNVGRNGRIDVAIFRGTGLHEQSHCAIELKGFNPSRKSVINDLTRNAHYFSIVGTTGHSSLRYAIFGALHSVQRVDDENKNLEMIRKKYKKWLSELPKSETHSTCVDAFSVRYEAAKFSVDDEGAADFSSDDNHHFIGVLVTYTSNSSAGAP